MGTRPCVGLKERADWSQMRVEDRWEARAESEINKPRASAGLTPNQRHPGACDLSISHTFNVVHSVTECHPPLRRIYSSLHSLLASTAAALGPTALVAPPPFQARSTTYRCAAIQHAIKHAQSRRIARIAKSPNRQIAESPNRQIARTIIGGVDLHRDAVACAQALITAQSFKRAEVYNIGFPPDNRTQFERPGQGSTRHCANASSPAGD